MLQIGIGNIHCLRDPSGKPGDTDGEAIVSAEPADDQLPEDEPYILCRQCRQALARPADRITVQGSHRHTFANPHGLVFEIGCFINVKGCGYAGEATNEFTWFAGCSWRVCFCALCLTHLGWIFSSRGGSIFYGLILDRLIEPN